MHRLHETWLLAEYRAKVRRAEKFGYLYTLSQDARPSPLRKLLARQLLSAAYALYPESKPQQKSPQKLQAIKPQQLEPRSHTACS